MFQADSALTEVQLPPGLVNDYADRVGQIEASIPGNHWQGYALCGGDAVPDLRTQAELI